MGSDDVRIYKLAKRLQLMFLIRSFCTPVDVPHVEFKLKKKTLSARMICTCSIYILTIKKLEKGLFLI